MRLWILGSATLWGAISLCAAAVFVGVLYWIARRVGQKEEAKQPVRPRVLKKHRPRGRAKKRVVRNAMKRRRFRKVGAILLSQDQEVVNPGGEQVGFFG